MDRASLNDDPELLLGQTGWVRGLARSLAVDAAGADDVAQEAILAALQSGDHGEGDVARLRAWLAKVVTNLSKLRVRRESRRRSREEWVARPEPTPSVADTVSRASQLRVLVEEVMELTEPYRSTVLLRYFESLPTAQVAESMECTPEAVRKRLSRALAMLRDRLDRKHGGDGSSWLAALAPLIGELKCLPLPAPLGVPTGVPTGAASTGTVMAPGSGLAPGSALATGAVAVAGAALLVGVGAWLSNDRDGQGEVVEVAEAFSSTVHDRRDDHFARGGRVALASLPPRSSAGVSPTRESRMGPSDSETHIVLIGEDLSEPTRVVSRPVPKLEGRVLDLFAQPVSGLNVYSTDSPELSLTVSGADGAFTLDLPGPRTRWIARSQDYATLRAAAPSDVGASNSAVIVVGPAVDLAGVVVDEWGDPVVNARISLEEGPATLEGFDAPLQRSVPVERHAWTDVNGRFAVEDWVGGADIKLVVEFEGYEPYSLPMPSVSHSGLFVPLQVAPTEVLSGIVVHSDGRPAPGARVQLAEYRTHTDDLGRFRLEHRAVSVDDALLAIQEGFGVGEVRSLRGRAEMISEAAPGQSNQSVQIVLGGPTGSISGVVRDPHEPQARAFQRWVVYAVRADEDAAEAAALSDPRAMPRRTRTDEDGSFLLTELPDADYIVEAVDLQTLLRLRSKVVRPGLSGSLELEVPKEPFRTVDGRLVAPDGAPLADARVSIALNCAASGCTDPLVMGQSARTDGQGRFFLPQVPVTPVDLFVEHPEVSGALMGLPDSSAFGDEVEIEVPRDRFVQVLIRDAAHRSIGIVDGEGQLVEFLDSNRNRRTRTRPRKGRSSVVRTDETAHEVVIFEGDRIVRRVLLGGQDSQRVFRARFSGDDSGDPDDSDDPGDSAEQGTGLQLP